MTAGVERFGAGCPSQSHIRTCVLIVVAMIGLPQQSAKSQSVSGRVSFRTPVREYVEVVEGNRTFFVESELAKGNPTLMRKSLIRLNRNIDRAISLVPQSNQRILHAIPFYVMYGTNSSNGGRDRGMVYFQRQAPRFRDWVDPHWGSSVVVYSAENYVKLTDFWALKAVFRELAHAYQLEQWHEKQPDIVSAYNNAMKAGLYHGVSDDRGKTIPKAYAAQNQLEYFAELSCMYFVGCNYFPMDRRSFGKYDIQGFKMIEKIWNPRTAPSEEQKPLRTWTVARSNRNTAARFNSKNGEVVSLKKRNGETFHVKWKDLSDLDQLYVSGLSAQTATATEHK